MSTRSSRSAVKARRIAGDLKRRLGSTVRSPVPARASRFLDAGDRLVPSPIFVYSAERSGSTLLRMILDCHSQICAPHEMHLRTLQASYANWFGKTAWKKLGVPEDQLANLLWDRLLHLMLTRTGKSLIVDKTPGNVFGWRRIAKSWPGARYIFLKRHPLRIVQSLAASKPHFEMERHYAKVNKHLDAWIDARAALPGPTVSYEELTADPERVIREICDLLGVPFEPAMLEYHRADHKGDYRRGLGDWNEKIKSGVIHQAEPAPDPAEIPAELRKVCRQLGYL